MQYQDDLTPICAVPFPSNHLLNISLVYRKPNNPNDRKSRYFVFVTLAPGEQVGQYARDRSYNFENQITLKYSLNELGALAYTLKELGKGNKNVIPYSKFSRSNNNVKSVSVSETVNQKMNIPNVSIFVNSGDSIKYGISMPRSEAIALGKQLEMLFELGQRYELQDQIKRNKAYKGQYNNPKSDQSIPREQLNSQPQVATPPPQPEHIDNNNYQSRAPNNTTNNNQAHSHNQFGEAADEFGNIISNTLK